MRLSQAECGVIITTAPIRKFLTNKFHKQYETRSIQLNRRISLLLARVLRGSRADHLSHFMLKNQLLGRKLGSDVVNVAEGLCVTT